MVNLGDITGKIGTGLSKGASTFFWGLAVLIGVTILGVVIYRGYKNKVSYKTPCWLTIIMENGTEKTRTDLRGGIFMDNNIRNFKINIPGTREAHVLGYMPDFSKADANGVLRFVTAGDSDRTIWQQYDSRWQLKGKAVDKEGKTFEYDLINKPVSRETKAATVNSIKNWRETIDKKKLTLGAMMIGGFIIMAIAHLISLFIQARLRCGT